MLQRTDSAVAEPVSFQLLSELGKTKKAPYHLINTALNLPASDVIELRGRDADFFLLSKHYCGSPIVGYHPTKEWEAADGRLDLGTAMAISGAAASPLMGSMTPRGPSFYLTLLNIRLGYWLHKPLRGGVRGFLARLLDRPGPAYLFREMLGWVNERGRFLNLSDGGHIENLGVYELLRRRAKYVIAIDGECDAKLQFPSPMRLQQFASIDLGIRIELDLNLLRLTSQQFSQVHFSMGRVYYPDEAIGCILYIKLSVSGNEDDFLLDYRAQNPQFPHQTTADQFFSERQFEAYRALGEHVTGNLFSSPLVDANERDLTVEKWFKSLADHLLVKV